MMKIIATIILFNIFLFSSNLAVIINVNNKLENIDVSELKNLYLKKIVYINNIKLIPIDNKSIRDRFNRLVIKRDSRRINAYWAKLIFSGGYQPPVSLIDDKEIISTIDDKETIKLISSSKNAIGYILESSLNKRVKLLKVISDR